MKRVTVQSSRIALTICCASVTLIALIGSTSLAAKPQDFDPEKVQAEIAKVLASPDFGSKRTEYEYEYVGEPFWDDTDARADSDLPSLGWLADLVTVVSQVVEFLLWCLVAVAIVMLIVYRDRWLHLLPRYQPRSKRALKPVPAVVMGMDVTPESLPEDVAATAWSLWQSGDSRGCMSLLYRGALSTLVARFGLDLPPSATERDCVARIRETSSEPLASYFQELTVVWQGVAYAGNTPMHERVETLCNGWRQHFNHTP